MNQEEFIRQAFPDDGTKADENPYKIPDYEKLFCENETVKKSPVNILKLIAKKNTKNVIISSLLYIIKNLAVWIIPIITANVINIASTGGAGSKRRILINAAALLVIIGQNLFSHVLYSKFTDKMLRTTGAGFRNTLIKKLQHLSVSYHKEIESGRLQAKFMRDIESIEFLSTHIMKSVIPSIISVLVSIGITASKSGMVTLFYIVVIPINVVLVNCFRGVMRRNNIRFRKENEDISAKVSDMLEMIPVTKAHGLENEEIEKLEKNIDRLRREGLLLDRTNAYFGSVSWILSTALSSVCLVFTGILALDGKIPVGDIVIYQTFFNSITGSVQSLVSIYPDLAKGLESVRSVSEIILSDDVENNSGKIRLRYVHGSIDFNHVYYKYPKTDKFVIKDFDLHVNSGECIAIVGASGSGKSTVINMIIGFLKATKGDVKVDGKSMELLDLSSYRQFISVVPQNSMLFGGTIRENIIYGLENVSEERLNEVIHLANIDEFADKLPNGIDTFIGEHGGKLSGGQKQRIAIARALIRDPKILILDEATSALDNISEYHVQQAMKQLISGRTTFIVAHRLSTIRDADRIVVMENGEAVEIGDYDTLMSRKGKFYQLKKLNG